MEQGEPALVPQWYKLANGNTSNTALRTSSSIRFDENGVGLGSRNRLLRDQDRNLRRSLSSNGSVIHDKGSSGKSQAYSSFRRSRDRNLEKDFDLFDRENRSVLVDNEFDHLDSLIGVRGEKDALRRLQSMVAGRQVDSRSKRLGSNANGNAPFGGSVIGSFSKTCFEKDFPSLQAEGRQGLSDASGVSTPGLRTAVQSLPFSSPFIIGTSALAEVPVKVETNGNVLSPVAQVAPISQASATGSTMTGLNMAEALAQLSVDTQRIEELTLKKCKQLIPMTPLMPKALSCNSSEKTKSKLAIGGDYSSPTKVGQRLHVNLTVGTMARSDIAKTSQTGNFQVLNREKKNVSPAAKDSSNVGKPMNPIGVAPSAVVLPLKSPTDQNLKVDNNGALSHTSFGERKLLTHAQNRNDFFNLLRKKSSSSSRAILEPTSVDLTSKLDKSEEDNLQITSPTTMENNNLSMVSDLDCSTEIRNCTNGDFCASDESKRFSTNNGETNGCADIVVDPEEEAFLQSLGWDKNAWEEALTKEEIEAFLKKHPILGTRNRDH
ncbi:uncharacterized protein LOC135631840 isoform X1 [Musa acuminata AAA Group]|uniref:uncharacterized protein LOC135631840 isoform X1 n=1 Tax=Musa acuminata AAA Group TaxID=214697 RepID=UPI0031DA2DE1